MCRSIATRHCGVANHKEVSINRSAVGLSSSVALAARAHSHNDDFNSSSGNLTCLVRTSTGFCLFCFPGWGLFVGDTRSERGLYQLIGQGLCGQMVAWSNGWIGQGLRGQTVNGSDKACVVKRKGSVLIDRTRLAWSNGWIERQVPATGGGTAMTAPLQCRRGDCGGGGGGVDVRRCRRCSIAIAIRGRTLTPALLGRRRWWFAVSERQLLSILDRPAGKERCHGDDRAAADGPNLQIRLARVVDVPLD